MTGRIEIYLHSDKSTFNKGGAMIRVLCVTDFAARTAEFIITVEEIAILQV